MWTWLAWAVMDIRPEIALILISTFCARLFLQFFPTFFKCGVGHTSLLFLFFAEFLAFAADTACLFALSPSILSAEAFVGTEAFVRPVRASNPVLAMDELAPC